EQLRTCWLLRGAGSGPLFDDVEGGSRPALRETYPVVLPLRPGLAPDVERDGVGRRRQTALAQARRSQATGDLLRSGVRRRDAMDDVVPAELRECPVDGGHRRLDG